MTWVEITYHKWMSPINPISDPTNPEKNGQNYLQNKCQQPKNRKLGTNMPM